MVTGGDDFAPLCGVVVLSRFSNSSKEKDDYDDSLKLLYTGMDAGQLDEVNSCGNLSDSDVSNESGRGNESMIYPSLPGTSSGSVSVSRHHAHKSLAEVEQDSCEESEETESCASDGNESKSEENSSRGKVYQNFAKSANMECYEFFATPPEEF